MTDIVDMTEDIMVQFPSENPYRDAPPRQANRMCLLRKTDEGSYFVSFTPNKRVGKAIIAIHPYSGAEWSLLQNDARRFADSCIAGEFLRFLELLPAVKPGETRIIWIDEANPLPTRPKKIEIVPERVSVAKAVAKHLTTYSGKGF